MTLKLPDCLTTAKSLRMPLWDNEDPEKFKSQREKLELLGDYIALTAFWQGECSAEVLDLQVELSDIEDQWSQLEGWEIHQGSRKTDRSVDEAKAIANPKLAQQRRDTKRLLKMLQQEIDRLEADSVKASRVVTTILGK